jgi:hypothetical protein
LSTVALVWVIEHDCVSPLVLLHVALFGAAAAVSGLVVFVAVPEVVACTTAQLPVVQKNVFLPPAAAI